VVRSCRRIDIPISEVGVRAVAAAACIASYAAAAAAQENTVSLAAVHPVVWPRRVSVSQSLLIGRPVPR